MVKNLVFYDGQCGLCDQVVQFLLRVDTQGKFIFAPLQGSTAAVILKDMPAEYKSADSVVLVENYQSSDQKFYVLGKAAFRILWILGGAWSLPGWISFLPSFLYDWGYCIVARNRHYFFPQDKCVLPDPKLKDRFLP